MRSDLRILIDAGNYFSNNDNHGDRAIYQIICRRLKHLWPDCEIHWITRNANLLKISCPDVHPLELGYDRSPLMEPNRLTGRFQAALLRFLGKGSILFKKNGLGYLRKVDEAIEHNLILSAIKKSDVVVATGGGYFNDNFSKHACAILDTLELAAQYGKPVVILSAGFEPVRNLELSKKLLTVLPKVDLIISREPIQGASVIQSYGVDRRRVAISGDDAVELAFEVHPSILGDDLGLNIRQADYSGVDLNTIDSMRDTLQCVIKSLGAKLQPIPISMSGPSDPDAIAELMKGFSTQSFDCNALNTPNKVIRQVGLCRMIITGSYHAAVFALSQGVSVVALAASPHYKIKLMGLKAHFGAGFEVLDLNRELTSEVIKNTINEVWINADESRPGLLAAAERQVVLSKGIYKKLQNIVGNKQPLNLMNEGNSLIASVEEFNNRIESALSRQGPVMHTDATQSPVKFFLTPEEIETFRTQGFVGPFDAFSREEMEDARQVIQHRVLPTPTPYCPFGLRVRHLDSKTVHDLCSAPAIVDRVASLFGPDLVLWNSNIFNKPPATPNHMEEYPWHQDHYNWNMEPILNISAWLAITPATKENGCVEVIPGSHKHIIPPVRDTNPSISIRFGGVASNLSYVDESKKVSLTLEPGQFFLFNERVLHHSNPNLTQESRLGLAIRITVPITQVSEPFPCILLSGKDSMGFNRYASKPTGEPDDGWLKSLPTSHSFMFDRPIPGMGWHVIENDGAQNFAWTGLEDDSWIDFLPLPTEDHVLRCEIAHILTSEAIDSIQLSVNGTSVTAKKQSKEKVILLEALIPTNIIKARSDRVRVSINVPKLVRPCDINRASIDKRTLGVAVRNISLLPVTEFQSA